MFLWTIRPEQTQYYQIGNPPLTCSAPFYNGKAKYDIHTYIIDHYNPSGRITA